jgi:crotonobetainyl-CoA:carnitine CoA-transferase CaiB-like acyl-CoA transferase
VLSAFDGARVPITPVNDLVELAEHPQVVARGSLVTLPDPDAGLVVLPGPVAHLAATPALAGPAPVAATPVEAVLAEWSP